MTRRALAAASRLAPLAALLLLAAAGCAAPIQALDQRDTLVVQGGTFEVRFAEVDRHAQEAVQRAMQAVVPELARWGGLRSPVTVRVLPSHEALEVESHREGVGALKAYALFDVVLVQSPRTWGLPLLGPPQRELERLLLHELTHCVLFQQSAARREDVAAKAIAFWFREGMASDTAREASRYASLEDLARFYDDHPGVNPLSPDVELYRREHDVVYGAAHHAFTFLVRRYGEDAVRAMMASMRGGRTFAEAFQDVIGLTREAFESEFRRYVTLRGFRSGRLKAGPMTD
ncbi:MAG: hypothetical protein L0Y66_19085 [Myxococcaceae bacterium]|nr:hypothetical protein [Myxococcaceae bacterium]MCI0669510.1 hypothetical protein [Myxococcaceae bacterium]